MVPAFTLRRTALAYPRNRPQSITYLCAVESRGACSNAIIGRQISPRIFEVPDYPMVS